MPFSPGQNVGPYRIVEPLGQGGMASVFKAYHPALDRYVALKVLHPAFLQDPNFKARFQREARVVAKLEHPNIVPIYDFSDGGGQPYLVMKYIEGRTLKSLLSEGPVDLRTGLEIVEAVGLGLGYAHQRGILHRDIKPSNVLLGHDGGIYLADFGLARIAQAGESTLSSDMLLGTPQYISPEQARGERDLDAGTDLYSLGVVLYELVVGRVPFNADTPFSIIHDHIYTPLPMPRQVNPRVPEAIERVLLKALAKERKDRFDDVASMLQAFQQAATGQTAPAAPDEPAVAQPTVAFSDELEPKSKGRRRWLWAAGGLVLACLCLLVFLTIVSNQEEQRAAATQTAQAVLSSDQALEATVDQTPEDPRILAARATVEAAPTDPEARVQLAHAFAAAGFDNRAAQVLVEAAELFQQREAHVEAAKTLIEAMSYGDGLAAEFQRVREMAIESLFKSASSPREIRPLLEEVKLAYPDWEAIAPIAARVGLFEGRNDEVVADLESLVAETPADPLTYAVLAEGYSFQGARPQALATIDLALGGQRVPTWLREHLDQLRQRLQAP